MTDTTAPVLGEATIQELREGVRGEVLDRRDPGYAEACRVWNGAHDGRRPALIVRCAGAADVVAAVGFARGNDLPVAVRGGGHSVAGFSTCDDGVVIDLSPMRGVRVDPAARIALRRPRRRVGRRRPRDAGARPGDDGRPRLDDRRRRASRSAAGSAGSCAATASRATTCRAADVVTADGTLVRADETRTPTCSGGSAAAAATSAS